MYTAPQLSMVLCETLAVDSKPLLPSLWEAVLHLMPCPLLPAYLKSAKPWNESHIISGRTEYFTAGGRKWDLPSRDCLQCILLGAAIGRSHTVQNTLEQTIIYLSATLVRFFFIFSSECVVVRENGERNAKLKDTVNTESPRVSCLLRLVSAHTHTSGYSE